MSTISYTNNNNNNENLLQQINAPSQQHQQQRYIRDGVLVGNQSTYRRNNEFNYRSNYRGHQYTNRPRNRTYNNNNNNYYYPNRNYSYVPNRNYSYVPNRNYLYVPNLNDNRRRRNNNMTYYNRNQYDSRPRSRPRNQSRIRPRSRPRNQSRTRPSSRPNSQHRSQSRNRQVRRGPRQLRLNDFMPQEFRDPSQNSINLPQDFNLNTAITTAPPDALPQRTIFTNNTTQPFIVNTEENNNDIPVQRTTTASYRRRQRRNRQQRYQRQNNQNHNRFEILSDTNNIDQNDTDNDDLVEIVELNKNNKDKKKNKKKLRIYLEPNRILKWFEETSKHSKNAISGRGNQAYTLATASLYDEWIRNNYELQIWQEYLKLGLENKFWAKEVIQRTKRRDDLINTRFVQKKIKRLTDEIATLSASISDLQIQLSTYWMHTTSEATTQKIVHTTAELTANLVTTTNANIPTTATTVSGIKNQTREPVDRLEKHILEYLHKCTQHVKKLAENRIQLAKAQKEEYKALEDFQQVATPNHWNTHLMLKPKIKLWSTKNKNYRTITERIKLDLPPKFISNVDFNFKIDESLVNQEESQVLYNRMRQITKNYRVEAMTLYEQTAAREYELITNEIKQIIENLPKTANEDEVSFASFKQYYDLREKRINIEAEKSIYFLSVQRVEGEIDSLQQEAEELIIAPTPIQHNLLKLGPRFIFNDPKTASRRRTTELATLKRKIGNRFLEKGILPGRGVEQFIAELDVLLQNLHDTPVSKQNKNKNKDISLRNKDINLRNKDINLRNKDITLTRESQSTQSENYKVSTIRKKKNYGRLIKRLKHKFRLADIVLRKSDKSKVFHLGKLEDYRKKSEEYMVKTQAYKCLGKEDPLPDLIKRTNQYLLELRLAKWITQKQYELLSIKSNEAELAHLYYLPKAHKPGTPLRPIISGLKHPTIKISKYLDDLLRPLFDKMAVESTVTSGFELLKQLKEWSELNINQETLFCTIDVVDLYTMIPQVEGVLSLKKMSDYLNLKQIGGLKIETIIRLSRFVMQNNYFFYDGQFYHQIRGGAMGSPLTLTIANCYMFFFEQQIIKQIKNSGGLYVRYIDDIFIVVNWPERHLLKQIDRWNTFDENIKLNAKIGSNVNFLDLDVENQNGILFTKYPSATYEEKYSICNVITSN
ncbi:unnamed protein product [Rotaria sordida]|uniref:Reverse transcriptase domain-containing protein n=1 Tax=Rotaria sordida TaxID=392033 RepID=A0A814JB91_9BILA|nr:unnamed protein product [Rotaria sordida]CAF1153678.1 unnamed protein product [Rotaria sordida]CAF3814152.1 unnamed protein product [Rotaria sordida]CAF4086893.1 unnamed protein product [Rotaria sordida]